MPTFWDSYRDGTQECSVAIPLKPGRADQDVIAKGQEKIGEMGLGTCQREVGRCQQGCQTWPIVWCCKAYVPRTHHSSSPRDGGHGVSVASAWRDWQSNASACATCSCSAFGIRAITRWAWASSVSLSCR